MGRVLAIGLDGLDIAFAERLMAEGRLPHLRHLRERGISARLDHGRDKLSGLAWEHVATGLAPSDGGRWSAVRYDAATYEVIQEETTARSFVDRLGRKVVAFDLPYCRLGETDDVKGMANWGAHDPGVRAHSHPPELAAEIAGRFGPYPAAEWIYGFCWPSAKRTEAAGHALVAAVERRTAIAHWLLSERLPDWDLAIVVPSEAHSGSEPLWHGVDPHHPLHGLPSSEAAGRGLADIYEALDRLVGRLADAFPDATVLAFSMHGMGINEADVPSMALLPELLYRRSFGTGYMRDFTPHGRLDDGTPLLAENDRWEATLHKLVPWPETPGRLRRRLIKAGLGRKRDIETLREQRDPARLGWMPATRYRTFWPRMEAFALPAFYDGQIRVNLAGREGNGIVTPDRYGATLDDIEKLLSECRDPISGEAAVRVSHRHGGRPADIGAYEADLYVQFRPGLLGITHGSFGTIGPLPWRRTGGHSGDWGFLFGAGPGLTPGSPGQTASSFDVVPTIVKLLGGDPTLPRSGTPLPGVTG